MRWARAILHISGPRCVEIRHAARRALLPRDDAISAVGSLRPCEPNSPRRDLNSREPGSRALSTKSKSLGTSRQHRPLGSHGELETCIELAVHLEYVNRVEGANSWT